LSAFSTFGAMIKSMTGFGKSQLALGMKTIVVDIRALNSKQFDLSLKIPPAFREKEGEIRQEIGKILERGKVDVFLSYRLVGSTGTSTINHELAKARFKELQQLAQELDVQSADLLGRVLQMPDVMAEQEEVLTDEEWQQVMGVLKAALQATDSFRTDEGSGLGKELLERVGNIEARLEETGTLDAERMVLMRERLNQKISDLKINADANRFEEEMIYYIEKLDINEEKQRLRTHCQYFRETLNQKESTGRKLGFIAQEMGREINTIGSKANHAGMQKLVVLMKDELEKIKEQLNNVL
jgi:uncharacterized protein (TIGR00255 family)